MNRKDEITGHLLAFFTVFVWGTTFISTKILLRAFTPIEILFIRFAAGLLLLFIVYPHRLKIKDRKQELYFIGAGLCGVTLYFLMENIALTHTLASNVGVIVSVSPCFTAILAHLFLSGEKLKLQFFVGFAVALIGIFLMSFSGADTVQVNPVGDILAVLAAAVWAVYSVITKKISEFHYNTIQTTRRIFVYGMLLMLPALFYFGFDPELRELVRPVNLFNILFLGLGASALCFVTWNWTLKILGAVKTSVYIYLVPVITVVASALILKEKITGGAAFGTVLTLAGLFISENRITLRRKISNAYDSSNE